jgi:hypothetical protein
MLIIPFGCRDPARRRGGLTDNNRPTRQDTEAHRRHMVNDERDRHPFYSDMALKVWRKKIQDLETEEHHSFKMLRPDPSRQDTEEREEITPDEQSGIE